MPPTARGQTSLYQPSPVSTSGYSDTSAPGTGLPNTFASRVDITSSFLHRIWSEQWLLADNVTIPPCCLRSADRFPFLGNFRPFPSCRIIRCLIPAPLLSLVVAYKPSGRLRSHMTSTIVGVGQLCLDILYHLLIGLVTE